MSCAERDPKLSECSAVKFSKKLDAFTKLSAAERRDIVKLPEWYSVRCFPDNLLDFESSNSTEAQSEAPDQMGKARSKYTLIRLLFLLLLVVHY